MEDEQLGVLQVQVGLDASTEAEEVDKLARNLRRSLLELDVDSVTLATQGETPEGARAVDAAALGVLLVSLAKSRALFESVFTAIRDWLSRDKHRTAEITIGNDKLILRGVSQEDQRALVESWIDRHSRA